MAPNLSLTFKKVPEGMPVAGEHLVVDDVGIDVSAAPGGGIVTENLYASFDPYLRGRMRGSTVKSYTAGFEEGSPVQSQTLGTVIKSDNPKFKEGATVIGMLPVQEYSVLDSEAVKAANVRIVDVENGPKDIRDFLGALGGPGLTAYASLYEIGKPKKGEVIFISSAAGAVGQIVGQLSKREGLKVIGSAGSDEKCKLCVEKLGFDECWNYKKVSAGEALDKYCPDGIDIYYGKPITWRNIPRFPSPSMTFIGVDKMLPDNVGGEQLDAALERMTNFGRIVACGMISGYNDKKLGESYGVKNLMNIIAKRITMQGFLVFDENMMKYAGDHQKNVTKWLNNGEMVAISHEWVGMKEAPNACIGVLKGENFGKAVLKIKV